MSLIKAIQDRKLTAARRILRNTSYDVNKIKGNTHNALMIAVQDITDENDTIVEIINLILCHRKCDVNFKNASGITALMASSYYNVQSHIGTKLILAHKHCDLNAVDETNGQTALFYAIHNIKSTGDMHATIAKLLLSDARCDVNQRNNTKQTALMVSCNKSAQSHVGAKLILAHEHCDVKATDEQNDTALFYAVRNINSAGDTHATITKLLLDDARCDVNQRNNTIQTALMVSCNKSAQSHVGAKFILAHKHCDVNSTDGKNYTALFHAVRNINSAGDTHATITKLLLDDVRCDVNHKDKYERTVLMVSCYSTRQAHAGAQLILAHKQCNLNATDEDNDTALFYAMRNIKSRGDTHATITQLLLDDARCDVNHKNKYERTALMVSCYGARQSHVGAQLILAHIQCNLNATNEENVPALFYAMRNIKSAGDTHATITQLLLDDARCDVNTKHICGKTALMVSCFENIKCHIGTQLILAHEQCNVNATDENNETALFDAIRNIKSAGDTHAKITQLLLDNKQCDVNHKNRFGQTALIVSCFSDIHSHIGAQLILTHKQCDVNASDTKYKMTALFYSIRNIKSAEDTHATITRRLLDDARCNVNFKNCFGQTALMVSCFGNIHSHIGAQHVLTHKQCDVNATDTIYTETVLFYSISNIKSAGDTHAKITRLLLDNKECDVNHKNCSGQTALMVSCFGYIHSHIGAQLILTHKQCNVNATDTIYNETALFYSIRNIKSAEDTHAIIARQLLDDARCDINFKNRFGQTSLMVSCFSYTDSPIGAQLILAHKKCDVNATDKEYGHTALLYSIRNIKSARDTHAIITRNLLDDARCDVNFTNRFGQTALMVSCFGDIHSHIGAQLILTHQKCKVNATDKDNNETALFYSIFHIKSAGDTHATITKLLLDDERCDVYHKNMFGQTALMMSKSHMVKSIHYSYETQWLLLAHPRCKGMWFSELIQISNPDSCVNVLPLLQDCLEKDKSEVTDELIAYLSIYSRNEERFPGPQNILCDFLLWNKGLSGFRPNDTSIELIDIIFQRFLIYKPPHHLLAFLVANTSISVCQIFAKHVHSLGSESKNGETALHAAIRLNSAAKVSLLLSRKANLKAIWRKMTALDLAISSSSDKNILMNLVNVAAKNQLQASIERSKFNGESSEECAQRLGIDISRNSHTEVHSCDIPNTILRQDGSAQFSMTLNPDCNRYEPFLDSPINILNSSRRYDFIHPTETFIIRQQLLQFLHNISSAFAQNAQFAHVQFIPRLAGSVAEDTKCFAPNEFDFICEMLQTKDIKIEGSKVAINKHPWIKMNEQSKYINQQAFSNTFYDGIDCMLHFFASEGRTFGYLYYSRYSLQLRDKISRLHLMWNGSAFKNMSVYVDLVPAIANTTFTPGAEVLTNWPETANASYHLIAKMPRYALTEIPSNEYELFSASYSFAEQKIMHSFPLYVRQGYTVAKAMRIVSICRLDYLSSYNVDEPIKTDDCITSYMLKTTLFHLLQNFKPEQHSTDPLDWAEKIFIELKSQLEKECMYKWYLPVKFMDCSKCETTRGCCLRRRFTIALIERILIWFKQNRHLIDPGMSGKLQY